MNSSIPPWIDPPLAFLQVTDQTLAEHDLHLAQLLQDEHARQSRSLSLVASSSIMHPSVLACLATSISNRTAEGYPGRRFHGGCQVADQVEMLAIKRACTLFGAQYANVQPHSAANANQAVMFALLEPEDRILGMQLQAGGHLTHGSPVSFSGWLFDAMGYGLGQDGLIDYNQVRDLAHSHRPKLIICGATSYPRRIDFARFREIADEVGAYLLADITHIAGLVAAGIHPSPIDHAHVTTTCTHKQLYGPRGGMILLGNAGDTIGRGSKLTLAQRIERAVFPLCQGAPQLNVIAGKARALALAGSAAFRRRAQRIVADAAALAEGLKLRGYRIMSGGTDNHIVLVDVATSLGLSGFVAERALEEVDIIVNRNSIVGDCRSATITSGIRLGTNGLAAREIDSHGLARCLELLDRTLRETCLVDDRTYSLPGAADIRAQVHELCAAFPIKDYFPVDSSRGIGHAV